MPRLPIRSTLAASALFLAACEIPPTAPTREPVGTPRSAVLTNEHRDDLVFTVNDCNGEVLSGTAKYHVIVGTTYDAAGGSHFSFKAQISNLKLTGASGTSYVGSEQQLNNYSLRPVQPGVILTLSRKVKLIGRGGASDRFLSFLSHYSVNANGEQTSYFSDLSIECR